VVHDGVGLKEKALALVEFEVNEEDLIL
jgi:hypothetical protein